MSEVELRPGDGRIGMCSAAEVRRNAAAFSAEVPAQLRADLRGEGLLDERAPVGP